MAVKCLDKARVQIDKAQKLIEEDKDRVNSCSLSPKTVMHLRKAIFHLESQIRCEDHWEMVYQIRGQ